MPGLNDIITVWTESGKQKVNKKINLTMFVREVYLIYNEIHNKQ